MGLANLSFLDFVDGFYRLAWQRSRLFCLCADCIHCVLLFIFKAMYVIDISYCIV